MKTLTTAALCGLLALASCAQLDEAFTTSSNAASYAADMPTEEEAAAAAAAEIDQSNAEQEFLKLKAEIEGAGDGF